MHIINETNNIYDKMEETNMLNKYLDIAPEVKAALDEGRPVVHYVVVRK